MKEIQEILNFLTELRENNNREWFTENKARFVKLKENFEDIIQHFIDIMGLEDQSIAHLKAKDCVYRIYKDVRFSKDKRPYKTHFGAYINEDGRKGKLGGYYIHLEPEGSLIGGGVWAPPSDILYEIRDAIYADTNEYKDIIYSTQFKKIFGELQGEKLKRGPKDFPKDFEDIELLKNKSFLASHPLSNNEVTSTDFVANTQKVFRTLKPLNDFLNRAIKHMEE